MEPSKQTSISAGHRQRAEHAMSSRLLSCIINTRLAAGQITESHDPLNKLLTSSGGTACVTSWCLVFKSALSECYSEDQIVFAIPLLFPPLHDKSNHVTLIDPEEFGFPVFHRRPSGWEVLSNPAHTIISHIQDWVPEYPSERYAQICEELENSVAHLAYAYASMGNKSLPSLEDPAMAWEQSIIEAHPIHPMNKLRYAIPPIPRIPIDAELLHPIIQFVVLQRADFKFYGPFLETMSPISTKLNHLYCPEKEFILPVHSYQIPNVFRNYATARLLEYQVRAEACLNVRTVQMTEISGYHFKLPLGIVITGRIRTLDEYQASIGRIFAPLVEKALEDSDLLRAAYDVASVVYNHSNPEVAEHISCLIRKDPEALCKPGERLIVLAALLERDADREFAVNKIFDLNSVKKRWNFFSRFTSLFLRAFIPLLVKFGFCFEAHPQNILAIFNESTTTKEYELTGFVARGFDGIHLHRETLETVTQITLPQDLPRAAESLELLHDEAYFTMIHSNLFRFVRALGFWYKGEGVNYIRNELDQILPLNCPTRQLWLEKKNFRIRAFIQMKLLNRHAYPVHTEIPNVFNYQQ